MYLDLLVKSSTPDLARSFHEVDGRKNYGIESRCPGSGMLGDVGSFNNPFKAGHQRGALLTSCSLKGLFGLGYASGIAVAQGCHGNN